VERVHRKRALRRRRLAAVAGLAALAVVAGFAAQRLTGLAGVDERGAEVSNVEIDSRAVGETLDTTVVVPAALSHASHPPLLVLLHGRGGEAGSEASNAFYSAMNALGSRAPVVALPDGGDHSYWHDRADGRWGRYIVREVIPEVTRRFGTDARRVAIGGISMGGFGAFDVARLNRGRFCAVGGHSPALWRSSGETAPGAFDDAEDFAQHDVVGAARSAPAAFAGARVWIDGGDSDPFRPGIDAFTAALRSRWHADLGAQVAGRPRRRVLERALEGLRALLRRCARALPRRDDALAAQALLDVVRHTADRLLERLEAGGLALLLLLAGPHEDESAGGNAADHDRGGGARPVARVAHGGQLPVGELGCGRLGEVGETALEAVAERLGRVDRHERRAQELLHAVTHDAPPRGFPRAA
jgi:poly(3-hydroxybutyrate) depolymerase